MKTECAQALCKHIRRVSALCWPSIPGHDSGTRAGIHGFPSGPHCTAFKKKKKHFFFCIRVQTLNKQRWDSEQQRDPATHTPVSLLPQELHALYGRSFSPVHSHCTDSDLHPVLPGAEAESASKPPISKSACIRPSAGLPRNLPGPGPWRPLFSPPPTTLPSSDLGSDSLCQGLALGPAKAPLGQSSCPQTQSLSSV